MKKLISLWIVMALSLSGFSGLAEGVKDGTYTASAEGKDGPVVVQTTLEGGRIASVVVTEQNATHEIAALPLAKIPSAIVEANAWNVDSITGATVTSDAIKDAVRDAIVQAGGDPAAYEKAAEAGNEAAVVNMEADVVVVGAGAAGVTAALAAQQNGARTILLEKAAAVGGVSIIAGGPMGIDSRDQQEAGVAGTFTIQQVWRDWMDYNCWLCDGTLFYNLFKDSGSTVDWLEENGMEFSFMGNEQAAHADGYPTYHIYADQENKYGYYQTLVEKFTEAGGTLYLQTAGYELEAENDTITGIRARQADGTVLDIACRAVCLCTGGFAANEEAVTSEVGFHLEEFSTGTQTGDGAAMSQAIGAGKGKTIQQLHGITSFSGIRTGSGEDKIAMAMYIPNCIWVSVRGSRFCPEDLNYDTALASNSTFAQGEYFYAIISREMAENLEKEGASFYGIDTTVNYEPTIPLFTLDNSAWQGFISALEDGCEKGIVFKGDTAEALAESMGVDAANLKATIEQYNADCEAGADQILGKDARYLTSLGEGGYYAVKARPMSLGAIGGVLVNSNLQVIKADGTVINGLYAAGADVAEFYNNSYPLIEGVTLGAAFNGGRMIGTASAEYTR